MFGTGSAMRCTVCRGSRKCPSSNGHLNKACGCLAPWPLSPLQGHRSRASLTRPPHLES